MPTIEMKKRHRLDQPQARQKVEELGRRLSEKYGLSGGWEGEDRYAFSRSGVNGLVKLAAGEVSVRVELSFLLAPLRSTIEQKLREGLEREFV